MVDAFEAGRLLAILALTNDREPSAAKAQGWAYALDDLPFAIAEPALRAALRAADAAYITPQTIRKHAQPLLHRLRADVRSAKARRLVELDWPETQPLPVDVTDRLRREWEATNDAGALASQAAPERKRLEQ